MPSNNDDLPDISSMKLSELKKELHLYGIDSANFCEKHEFTSALDNARKTLPRPTTTYREVEPTEEEIKEQKEKEREKEREKRAAAKAARKSSTGSSGTSRRSQPAASAPTPAASASAPAPAAATPAPTPSTQQQTQEQQQQAQLKMKKLLASRSPLTALQQIKEHPSEKLVFEQSISFLPGSPFSFSLRGSLFESDSTILRIPDGVKLTISAASVERKSMEEFSKQKGSIGVSLRISTEENPQLLPIWTFDKEKSKSYGVTDLGVVVCGPRTVRLLAYMEMGFSSKMSVDVGVFGSVSLDGDKFD
mmetsp:Transcript_21728/g.45714  ORF Transcript_21728/g.45714 Transcript_21728/m.45714 type:complete len:306 (-) Transcript_21728:315-1232(-)|eukprot:CAMPEP_0171330466 /NCGR_PEP_ID=MMETSP0878-20121228/2015_1 /TAXON_ID=67004 /ORGANISM="Thalassiosira weissflogii, Strain CCMP1336" /LENGTH=305 /DNA_ID=CAMNT_0011830753 /DNA_START=57 /DNA_END=974 /DNA_ORIENTATION=-